MIDSNSTNLKIQDHRWIHSSSDQVLGFKNIMGIGMHLNLIPDS